MASRSLRSEIVPINTIFLYPKSGTIPTNYTIESSLFDKFVKGTATAGTNPGSSTGSDSHSETSAGSSHTHPATGWTHVHSTQLSAPDLEKADGPGNGSPSNVHTHTQDSGSTSPSITSAASSTSFAHTHASTDLKPQYITDRFLKHTGSIGLRRKHIPFDINFLWNKTLASIPLEYQLDSTDDTKFLRGVPDGSTAPGTTAGNATHQHAGDAEAHTHALTVPTHTHTFPTSGPAINDGVGSDGVGSASDDSHTHPPGTRALATNSGSGTSAGSNSHQHAAIDHTPEFHELAVLKIKIIHLRKPGLTSGAIVGWLDLVSTIPLNYQVADGTNSTPNLLSKYIRIIPNDSTNPGTTGGATQHTHTAQTHTHTSTSFDPHTHTVTGQEAEEGFAGNSASNGLGLASRVHDHTAASSSASITSFTNAADGSHSHAATNSDPASIEMSYIQRL